MTTYLRKIRCYLLVRTGLTVEVSRTDRVFIFLVQKGQIQFNSSEDLYPCWKWIIGMHWRPLAPIKVTPLFLFGGTSKRSATPFQAVDHSQTYYKLSNHLANGKKKSLHMCWCICTIFPALPLSCFRHIPPALSWVTFLNLKWEAPPTLFLGSWQVCSCAGPVMLLPMLRLLQKVQCLIHVPKDPNTLPIPSAPIHFQASTGSPKQWGWCSCLVS